MGSAISRVVLNNLYMPGPQRGLCGIQKSHKDYALGVFIGLCVCGVVVVGQDHKPHPKTNPFRLDWITNPIPFRNTSLVTQYDHIGEYVIFD